MKHHFYLVATLLSLVSFGAFSQKQIHVHEHYLDNLFNSTIRFDTTLNVSDVSSMAPSHEWKQWKTVDNFYFGKNRGALPMIADLEALHPFFRDKVIELIRICKDAGITLAIVETYRTPSKQAEYFAMGRAYTNTSGGRSRHQYGLAVDLVPVVDSVAVWNNHRLWRKIGVAGERLGLRWGGRWKVLYDPGHFEWTGGVSRYALGEGVLPGVPASHSDRYPDLDQQIQRLREFWEAWEVEQSVIASKGKPVISNR
jgi:hypothetical protein